MKLEKFEADSRRTAFFRDHYKIRTKIEKSGNALIQLWDKKYRIYR